jgi:predicted nucleic acid-binding protein
MVYLTDTNILLRLLHRADPEHSLVRSSLRTLQQRREQLCYVPQNLVEFWRVCTRPISANGFGLSVAETDRRARLIERLFTLLPDRAEIHSEWRSLVVTYEVSGVQVHDARLVAAMHVYGLRHLLTLNVSDFARYPDVIAIQPQDMSRQATGSAD